MSVIRRYCILLLLCTYYFSLSADNTIRQGLYFFSFDVDKDKRTCLNLTPEKPLNFPKGFSMELELKFRPGIENFGYVFRIIGNDSLNIDLISEVGEGNFSLVIGKNTILQFSGSDNIAPISGHWIKVIFASDPANGKVTLAFNSISKTANCDLKKLKNYNVFLGGNTNELFSTIDVPPMVVKNIRFNDDKQKLIRNWELAKHGNGCVYDECVNDKAIVTNPRWEVDDHAEWKKVKTFLLPEMYQQIAFDEQRERIFIVKEKNIIVFNVKDGQTDTIKAAKGMPFNTMSNQLVYDSKNNQLISYEFNYDQLSRFSFETNKWDKSDFSKNEPLFWHHSKYFRPEDSTLITMGGYGFHKYSGLLQTYSETAKIWKTRDLSKFISPRYLGSMGSLNDSTLLYFGGFGNESGNQRESPHNDYNLYFINTNKLTSKKKWELETIKSHFTNANSLIANNTRNTFYTLSYPNKRYETYIVLHEYNINKPEFQILGDSIPYFFNDVESYCDLFRPTDQSKLITVTSTTKSKNSEINIYTIAYPPLNANDIYQTEKTSKTNWTLLFLIVSPVFLYFIILVIRKQYKKKSLRFNKRDLIVKDTAGLNEMESNTICTPSIHLLGDFQVIDSEGNNITSLFTPTTKQVFLLLLLFTIKTKEGVSSLEFRNLLWFDKDDDSARNNRNVYINRLRIFFKKMGDIKILNQKGYWSVSFDSIFCDYERVLVLISSIKVKSEPDKVLLSEMLKIASKGKLLPFHEIEWLDDFKNEYSNLIIDFLLEQSQLPEWHNELMLLLKISEVILIHDDIEEAGIRLKCHTLFRLGKKKQALQSFNKFAEEHLKLLAIETKLTFEDLIKNKP